MLTIGWRIDLDERVAIFTVKGENEEERAILGMPLEEFGEFMGQFMNITKRTGSCVAKLQAMIARGADRDALEHEWAHLILET